MNDFPPPMNHVFVDFENVHKFDPSIIGTKSVSFTLLVGAKQTKMDTALVEKLIEHASSVQLVRLTGEGKNALDFTLSYYLGRTVLADPTAYFHIISKDKGFDPLVDHMRSRHIHVRRHDNFESLTFSAKPKETRTVPKPEPAEQDDAVSRATTHLRKNATNRPKKKKTLLSHLKSLLGKDANPKDAEDLLEKLQRRKLLTIGEKDAVIYDL